MDFETVSNSAAFSWLPWAHTRSNLWLRDAINMMKKKTVQGDNKTQKHEYTQKR